jgi:hypothetical protein
MEILMDDKWVRTGPTVCGLEIASAPARRRDDFVEREPAGGPKMTAPKSR